MLKLWTIVWVGPEKHKEQEGKSKNPTRGILQEPVKAAQSGLKEINRNVLIYLLSTDCQHN